MIGIKHICHQRYKINKYGLNKKIYSFKPLDEDNFINSKKLDEFEDVKNIVERINLVVKTINAGINS